MADGAEFHGAIDESPGGVLIHIMVTPNATNPGLKGYNTWRGRLEFRVSAEAKRSRANEELCRRVAELFRLAPKDVEVVTGAMSHEKTLLVRGVGREAALRVLGRALGEVG